MGITSRPAFDRALVGHAWAGVICGMRVSPTRPYLGLIDLIKALRRDAIRTVKCPPWRAP